MKGDFIGSRLSRRGHSTRRLRHNRFGFTDFVIDIQSNLSDIAQVPTRHSMFDRSKCISLMFLEIRSIIRRIRWSYGGADPEAIYGAGR